MTARRELLPGIIWNSNVLMPGTPSSSFRQNKENQNLKAKGFDFSHNVLCREHYDISQVRRSSEATSSCSEIIVFIKSGGTMHIQYPMIGTRLDR